MPSVVRGRWSGRLARRLALAFVATAVAAAALTAILVNVAIGFRFDAYLESQRQAREQEVVAVLAADYLSSGGWRRESLDELAQTLVMSGTMVELLGRDGRLLWTTADFAMSPRMSAIHREMMDIPQRGPASRLPVVVDGRTVGTAVLRVPQAALPAADREFRSSVNWLLTGGAIAAGALALLVGLAMARRTTIRVAELTAAANDLAAGRRERRANRVFPR